MSDKLQWIMDAAEEIADMHRLGSWSAELIENTISRCCPEANAVGMLVEACREFVRKVECGEALSKRSYAQMKAALANYEKVQK